MKYIYFFGGKKTEGKASMKELLGGKGANLAEMTNIGIPVPPGFTISTQACVNFYKNKKKYPPGLANQINQNLKKLEDITGKIFGKGKNLLLLSVRSGSRASMPGMMDTILNLGLNDQNVKTLAEKTGKARFAQDVYRRLIQMFGDVVLGVRHEEFEKVLERAKRKKGVKLDAQLEEQELKELINQYKNLIKRKTGSVFPQDPKKQLKMAIKAVFNSWNNSRAATYRQLNNIPHNWGTAVNVQSMVFGNLSEDSGTGVAFTRNPANGQKKFYGEYLMKAQGEDVVAGIRTPLSISRLKKDQPRLYSQLEKIYKKLERHYKDMQDLEFTIEKGRLYLLQTRTGKRTAMAAVKIAVDMVKEGLIDKKEALLRVLPQQLDQLLHPMIDPRAKVVPIATGLPASPGAAVGRVVFDSNQAQELAQKGEKVILVRLETSPEDVGGMSASQGTLTSRGGMTSHAAVVGRGMGKCCVVGCNEINVNQKGRFFTVGNKKIKEGDLITLNGTTGQVMLGELALVEPKISGDFKTLLRWADAEKKLGVRTNADTPLDSKTARDLGAQGIGLCRTEHMFFGQDRLPLVRRMIMAQDKNSRSLALKKLLPLQKQDFKEIFKVMKGLPVTIRLLDPPLHEFLPKSEAEIKEAAGQMHMSTNRIRKINESLHETNPMLGHRGCRLGITFPEIYKMQTRAIIEASCELKKNGQKIIPEIMIPLVGHINELNQVKKEIIETTKDVLSQKKINLKYKIGTMIEIPRAALTADEIAQEAEFFSFGTNDLTQMTFGFSRDDIAKFLPDYLKKGIIEKDPFQTIDQRGVGELIEMAVKKGRTIRPELKIGICGEHGGDPDSIEFCHKIGLDYVSCSPFRVPIARLAAAQAALRHR